MGRPTMFMLAGPNGAGKSTLYELTLRPRIAAPFIKADLIQRDELKDRSMVASYRAAEIAEERRQACLFEGCDFVSESTFSHPSKLALIREARAAGFRIVMYHVNVQNADLSVLRVDDRTREGATMSLRTRSGSVSFATRRLSGKPCSAPILHTYSTTRD